MLWRGPRQYRCSNLRFQKLDLRNVTEAWRIVKTWKYLLRECVSLNVPVKKIAEKFQLTNVQAPGAALRWMTSPSQQGTVIAVPLWTETSPLRGKAIYKRKTPPSPRKLPHFLQKYPSSNPKIRNKPQASQEVKQDALVLLLPPNCHQERGNKTHLGSFSMQRAEGSWYNLLNNPLDFWVLCHLSIEWNESRGSRYCQRQW